MVFIPRVTRGYERQDYSALLDELKGLSVTENDEKVHIASEKQGVDAATRCRASLLDNPKMLYAYSNKSRVLHDRDCSKLAEISDAHFRMVSEFPVDMKVCSECYRRAIIRRGVGDDRKRIPAYERFFNKVRVSDSYLYDLMIKNKALVKLIDNNVMEITVREDTWQFVCGSTGYELWHNNYICLKDGSRYFTKGFHRQTVFGGYTAHNILRVILTYRCDIHKSKTKTKLDKRHAHEELLKEHENRREFKRVLGGLVDGTFRKDEYEDALLFLNSLFENNQVKEIVKGAERGLSLQQILIYAKPEFVAGQMKQIRSGLELHIGKKYVKSYALPELSVKEMRKAKIKLFLKKSPVEIYLCFKDRLLTLVKRKKKNNAK